MDISNGSVIKNDVFYDLKDRSYMCNLLKEAREKSFFCHLQYFPSPEENIKGRRVDSFLTWEQFFDLAIKGYTKKQYHFVFIVRRSRFGTDNPYIETGISMIYDDNHREHICFIYIHMKQFEYFKETYNLIEME